MTARIKRAEWKCADSVSTEAIFPSDVDLLAVRLTDFGELGGAVGSIVMT